LLELLADGLTDEAAANRLGLCANRSPDNGLPDARTPRDQPF
jgi:hypothetical protein